MQLLFLTVVWSATKKYALFLNNANCCLGASKISQGGIGPSVVDIRIVLQIALKANAAGIILCHNHPTGNLRPGKDDDSVTQKLNVACEILNLKLLDHVMLL